MTMRTETNRTTREPAMNGGAGSTTAAEGDRLKEAASGLAEQASRTAEAQASTAMTKAGEALEQVAQAVRDAGSQMREQRPEIANFAGTAAERVDQASQYLREHDAKEVLDEVQNFSRRQPMVVIGGALALGLLAGRFLSSGRAASGTQGYATMPRSRALTTPDLSTSAARRSGSMGSTSSTGTSSRKSRSTTGAS
jgi:ElaB/YqjD/DUF883 family membrane-anchored ribosome-binding protein